MVSTSTPSRVWVRGEFEPTRAMASCTSGVVATARGVFVSGVRATIFSFASMTVPAHPAGSPACPRIVPIWSGNSPMVRM